MNNANHFNFSVLKSLQQISVLHDKKLTLHMCDTAIHASVLSDNKVRFTF